MEAAGGEERNEYQEGDSADYGKKETAHIVTPDEKIAALLEESKTLTPDKDSARLLALYKEAAALVDRKEKPKKWAAFRFLYGQLSLIHI